MSNVIVDRLKGIADEMVFVKHEDRSKSDDWRRGMSRAISIVLQARDRQLAFEAYDRGEWCGECQFGVVEDPPCCTKSDTVIQCAAADFAVGAAREPAEGTPVTREEENK